jgi:hypothetical protein
LVSKPRLELRNFCYSTYFKLTTTRQRFLGVGPLWVFCLNLSILPWGHPAGRLAVTILLSASVGAGSSLLGYGGAAAKLPPHLESCWPEGLSRVCFGCQYGICGLLVHCPPPPDVRLIWEREMGVCFSPESGPARVPTRRKTHPYRTPRDGMAAEMSLGEWMVGTFSQEYRAFNTPPPCHCFRNNRERHRSLPKRVYNQMLCRGLV